MKNEIDAVKYDYLTWRHVYASLVMLTMLVLGNVVAKIMTPELPSTLTFVGLLVGILLYSFIMTKGRENCWQATGRVLFLVLVFTAFLTWRHQMIVGDPEVLRMVTSQDGYVTCGELVQNLCNIAHLKYIAFLAWI